MSKNELSQISMMMITYAEKAKFLIIKAIAEYKAGDVEFARKKIEEAEEYLKLAEKEHFKAIIVDFESPIIVDVLYIHAEDQLMNANTILLFAKSIFM